MAYKRPRDFDGAGDRGRTGTIGKDRRILSPVRLPIPPLRHIRPRIKRGPSFMAPERRLELPTLRLTAACSTIELLRNKVHFFTAPLNYTILIRPCQEKILDKNGFHLILTVPSLTKNILSHIII